MFSVGGYLIWHENSLFGDASFKVYQNVQDGLRLVETGTTFHIIRIDYDSSLDRVRQDHNSKFLKEKRDDKITAAWAEFYKSGKNHLHDYSY